MDTTELDGTVTDVYWINPHPWIYVDVNTEKGMENWAISDSVNRP